MEIKNEKVILIDERTLGKTKIVKNAALTIQSLGDSKIFIYATDIKKMNEWLDEILLEENEEDAIVYTEVGEKKKGGYADVTKNKTKKLIKRRSVNVSIIPMKRKITHMLNFYRTSPYHVWIIDVSDKDTEKMLGNKFDTEFESATGITMRYFQIDDQKDWIEIMKENNVDVIIPKKDKNEENENENE